MFRKGSRGNTDMMRGHMKQELDTRALEKAFMLHHVNYLVHDRYFAKGHE